MKGRQENIRQQRLRDDTGSGRKQDGNGGKSRSLALFLIRRWGKSMYSTVQYSSYVCAFVLFCFAFLLSFVFVLFCFPPAIQMGPV